MEKDRIFGVIVLIFIAFVVVFAVVKETKNTPAVQVPVRSSISIINIYT